MPVPDLIFRKTEFAELPGWGGDDHAAAFAAFKRSCGPLLGYATGSTGMGAFLEPVFRAAQSINKLDRLEARGFFEEHFAPYRLIRSGASGFVTGYFEPVLRGSREADGVFQVPLYRRPPDLVDLADESLRGAAGLGLSHARQTPTGFEPYFTRAEIEGGALGGRGLELVYVADPVEAFFVHVQGSAHIALSDGTAVRIGYDGKNGHPYSSIGRYLIERGEITAEDMTLASLGAWLRTDARRGREVMWRNPSFVFFRELAPGEAGPLGARRIPLSPGRSLAIDGSIHALGTPIHVHAPTLRHATDGEAFQRLMIAQDVGSAITGPERGDIYFGCGDEAGRLAGITKHAATFTVLLPREGGPP
jgi:membrane-bound lytic murein transglycosylase A